MGTIQSTGNATHAASCAVESDVGRATRSVPLQSAQSVGGGMAAARWRNPPVNTKLDPPDRHLLIFHQRGSTAIEASIGTSVRGHGSRIGSVTLVPAGTPSHWHLHGHCDVIHVYLEANRLRTANGIVQALAPAFARQDIWLTHWFGMLSSEMMSHQQSGESLAPLLADEFEGLLVSHLTSTTTNAAQPLGGLPGGALRRIDEFLDARLGDDLRLADLAAAACLSESHFIRAFRQSVGCTPWQYVLNRRLEVAEHLLLQGMASSDVASKVGLGNAIRLGRLYRQRRGVSLASLRMRTESF
jgi:AraC family transcriptional regulator